jgi:hypothetical protein
MAEGADATQHSTPMISLLLASLFRKNPEPLFEAFATRGFVFVFGDAGGLNPFHDAPQRSSKFRSATELILCCSPGDAIGLKSHRLDQGLSLTASSSSALSRHLARETPPSVLITN